MSRLTRRPAVLVLGVLGSALVAVAAARPWVEGVLDQGTLGRSPVAATGGTLAPGVVALALTAGAAALAAVATGRLARLLSLLVLLGSGLGVGGLTLSVLLDPAGQLGPVAAAQVGQSGTLTVEASTTVWPWLAFAGAVATALAGVLGLVGRRAWPGPSDRYERAESTASRAGRVATDWERISAGEDPTDVGSPPPT